MKILYLHQYFTTPDMSGGTRSYEFARRLAAQGHEVHMITSWTKPTDRTGWFESEIDGVNAHWFPVPYNNKMSYTQRIRAFFTFARQAGRRAIEIGGDVVFATSTPLTIAIPGVRASRRLKAPMVFEVRDLWPEMPIAVGALRNPATRFAAHRLERYAYQNAAHVVALSPGMEEGVLRVRPDCPTSVIYNSCDLDLFDPANANADAFLKGRDELRAAPIVAYAGTLGVINGVAYAPRIAAAAAAKGSDVRFIVVGDGAENALVRSEAERLGVMGKTFFHYDPVPKNQVPNLLKAVTLPLSLFVNIKQMEINSANKFFDALAAGKPIGINYGGWQADIVRERGLGPILPSNDPEAAATEILTFLSDPARVEAAGLRARETGAEMFNRDKLATQLEKVLVRAAAQKNERH